MYGRLAVIYMGPPPSLSLAGWLVLAVSCAVQGQYPHPYEEGEEMGDELRISALSVRLPVGAQVRMRALAHG